MPTTKTNKRSTADVIRNLSKPKGGDAWTEQWESLQSGSVEEFRDHAIRHLGQASNLRKVTLDSADWAEVFEHFHGAERTPAEPIVETPAAPASGHLVGYARVSTSDQDAQLQINALKEAGCTKIFTDKASGKNTDRPELTKALEYLRPGDQFVCWKVDRLSRSLIDLVRIVDGLAERDVVFRELAGFGIIDPTTPSGRLMLSVLGSVAEFERGIIRERTLAGLATAREAGRVGGRPNSITEEILERTLIRRAKGQSVPAIAKELGVSKSALYRALTAQAEAGTERFKAGIEEAFAEYEASHAKAEAAARRARRA